MRYRLRVPLLLSSDNGQRLSPIDYMVWKDHVNVLDQHRIFRLLAKGPRLDGYPSQLKKSEKLDFASWGGFAQNYSDRRIPFEHPSITPYWERAHAEHLFIPTFSTGPRGPYLPATALKGALRTGVVHGQVPERVLADLAARTSSEGRLPRRPASSAEEAALGSGGADSMKLIALSDSNTVPQNSFKVYLLRVATLESRGGGKLDLAWKQSPRGSVKRAEESTPAFAEMAVPGTTFEGDWRENAFLKQPESPRRCASAQRLDTPAIFNLVNGYTEQLLRLQKQYAEWTGLALLKATIEALETRLGEIRAAHYGCMLPLGWGAGFLSKAAFLNTKDENYRQLLSQVGFYARAIQSGLPFPKTRKIIFLANQPASLAGFVHLTIGD